jgi:hypothetical protein
MPEEYTTIQIRIFPFQADADAYPMEATLDDGSRFLDGELRLDEQMLLMSQLDPKAYGVLLFETLCAGPIGRAYEQATGRAEATAEGGLRVRLWIDTDAVRLHALPWERLYHVHQGQLVPLTTSAFTPFSRYMGLEQGEPQPLSQRPIRMLVTIANPTDLPADLPALSVDQEVENLSRALGDLRRANLLQVTIMPGRTGLVPDLRARLEERGYRLLDGVTSLDNLVRQWDKADIWHHVGHGRFKSEGDTGIASLYLEGEDGTWVEVKDDDLVTRLVSLGRGRSPHLIFLSACDSAKGDALHPLVGLAPKLVGAGVPAVVAMQDLVPVELARQLTADFYLNLIEHGEVDLAINQARLLLFERSGVKWAIPVLYSRLEDNKLINLPPPESVQNTDKMMRVTERILNAVEEQDVDQELTQQLEDLLLRWQESHQALVDLESKLRRLSEDPQIFATDFNVFYNDFRDYYNSETWVDENSLIRAVIDLRDKALPKLKSQMSAEKYSQVEATLDQQVSTRRRLVTGFDEFLDSMDGAVTEIRDLVVASDIPAAIQRKREFELEIVPNLRNSHELLKQMSQQVTTVAGLTARMRSKMRRGETLPRQEIVETIVAQKDAGRPLDAVTQDLMDSEGLDMRVVQQPGAVAVPPHVRAQIDELIAAQQTVAGQGMTATPQALYRLGMLAAYGRDYGGALDYFHQTTQADPGFNSAWVASAWLQQSRAMGDINAYNYGLATEKLTEAGQAAVQIQPIDARSLALQGFIVKSRAQVAAATNRPHQKQKLGQQAAALFQMAVALDPDNASAYNGLGNVAYMLDDLEVAIQAYRRALELKPTYAAAWHDLGAVYERLMGKQPAEADKWRQEALDAFRQARRFAEDDPSFDRQALGRLDGYIARLGGS